MTKHQQLDKILSYMALHLDEIPTRPDTITKKAGLDIDKATAYLMLDMMQTDGYVKNTSEKDASYILLYKGVIFVENGGYVLQLKHYKRQKLAQKISDYVDIFVKPLGILTAILVICWTTIQILKFFSLIHDN